MSEDVSSLVKKGKQELQNGGISKKLACMLAAEDDELVCSMDPDVWMEAVKACKVGEKKPHDKGYTLVYTPGHPFCDKKGYVYEHRLVLERHLRDTEPGHRALTEVDGELYLKRNWLVHHKDEDKTNTVASNLEAKTVKMHRRKHTEGEANPMYGVVRKRDANGKFLKGELDENTNK